jgi:hypothetical protein
VPSPAITQRVLVVLASLLLFLAIPACRSDKSPVATVTGPQGAILPVLPPFMDASPTITSEPTILDTTLYYRVSYTPSNSNAPYLMLIEYVDEPPSAEFPPSNPVIWRESPTIHGQYRATFHCDQFVIEAILVWPTASSGRDREHQLAAVSEHLNKRCSQ